MGKVRHPKKSRIHAKAQSNHLQDDSSNVQTFPSEGLPMEVLSDAPVLNLCSDTEKEHVTMKKKDRKALRHQKWLAKMQTIEQEKTSAALSEKRKQTPVVGDMHALVATLPDILESANPVQKDKRRRTTILSEVDHFQKVLTHPSFQSDPLSAITQHIRNAVTLGKV